MIRRSLRWSLIYIAEALALVLLVAIFAGGAALWRLSQGPVPLDIFREDAQQALAEMFEGDLVSLGRLEARYDATEGLILLRATDITVAESGGVVIARAPVIEAGLALDALILGRVQPVTVHVEGGIVSLVRRADGAVGAGLGPPEIVAASARPTGSALDTDAVLELLRDPARSPLLGRLRQLSIEDTSVHVQDAVNGFSWLIQDAGLLIERSEARLTVRLNGEFVTTAGLAPVEARVEAGADLETLLVEFRARNLFPRAVAPFSGPYAGLGALDAPLSVDLFASAARAEGVRAAEMTLEAGSGSIRFGDDNIGFDGARLDLGYDPELGEIALTRGMLTSEALTTGFSGRIHEMRGFADALPRRWRYELALTDGRIDLPGVFEAPPEWQRIAVSGSADAEALTTEFDAVELQLGNISAELTGGLVLREVAVGKWLPDIRLEGPIGGRIGPREVLAYWPIDLADGARVWVDEHVISGRLLNAQLALDIDGESIAAGIIPNDRLSLRFDFDDAAFHYITTMTPMTGASGSAVLYGNAFDLTLEEGRIGDMVMTEGFVDIPRLNPKGAVARFGGAGRAEAGDVLALIDQEPLHIPSDYGLDPASITGQGTMRFEIRRPMLSEVPIEDVHFDVEADFENISMPTGFGNTSLTGGTLHLTANNATLFAEGDANIGPSPAHIIWTEDLTMEAGEPSTRVVLRSTLDSRSFDDFGLPLRRYVDGPVAVVAETVGNGLEFSQIHLTSDLTDAVIEAPGNYWTKEAGAAATAELTFLAGDGGERIIDSFRLEGDGLELQASARFESDGRLVSADVPRLFVDGFVETGLSVSREGESGRLTLLAEGQYFNATGLFTDVLDATGEGGATPPLAIDVRLDRVSTTETSAYEEVVLTWRSDGAGNDSLMVTGEAPEGQFTGQMTGTGLGEMRRFWIEAPNFGRMLQIFGLYDNVDGGALRLEGALPPPGEEGTTNLRVEAGNFTLVRMPVLARILAAGSLEGLSALLNGGGIPFETLEADLTLREGVLGIANARAAGPALGVTVDGTVDLDEEVMGLDGVLAPSYGLNSLFGNLPLVGGLLVSREGEGVIGITFSVSGPFDQPTVFANPLSALVPGVLRRMFEGTAAERAARVRAEQQAERDALNAEPEAPDAPPGAVDDVPPPAEPD
ncbi:MULTISPECIES: YhdP family protein [Hyphobacterium]|uniref:AsmA-like C-terminal region-containing protein n=1 Tax=Hyphobacterium vulgare TaxID=1736751 RepID=A0ABV6ZX69_9PROT